MLHHILTPIILFALVQDTGRSCPALVSPWANATELWSIPFYEFGTNPGSAAASATHLHVVAENTNAPASLVGAERGQLLGISVPLDGPYKADVLVTPEGHTRLAAPRVAVDDSGTLHMVWGVGRQIGRGMNQTTRFDIWASSYRRDQWVEPQRIATLTDSWWNGAHPSEIVRTANGELHVIGPEFTSEGFRYPMHIARIGGEWTVLKSRLVMGSGYTALATRNDSLFMAFVAAMPFQDVGSSVWFRLSPDGGRHWNAPVLVSRLGRLNAREVSIVAERSGDIVIVWVRKRTLDDFFSGVLWMSRSRDAGQSWQTPTDLQPVRQLYVMGAVEHAPGVTDVLYWSGGPVAVTRICDRVWGEAIPVPTSLYPTGSAVLVHPPGRTPLVIWSAAIIDPRQGPRRVWLQSTLR